MENIVKNVILFLLIVGWLVATVMIAWTIIGFFLLLIIDEWWEFPKKILKRIE